MSIDRVGTSTLRTYREEGAAAVERTRTPTGYPDADTLETSEQAPSTEAAESGFSRFLRALASPFVAFFSFLGSLFGGGGDRANREADPGPDSAPAVGPEEMAQTAQGPTLQAPGATRVADGRSFPGGSIRFRNVNDSDRSGTVDVGNGGTLTPAEQREYNSIMYDWRADESRQMDPALLRDILAIQRELGVEGNPVILISGYRTEETQMALVRARRTPARGLGYHPRGQAIDLAIEGVPYARLIEAAERLQARGEIQGLNGYPRGATGTHQTGYIHIDTGPTRTW